MSLTLLLASMVAVQSAPGATAAPAPATPPRSRGKDAFPPPGDATPKKPAFPQKTYECAFAKAPIKLDGKLDDEAWKSARWSDEFVDIQGPELPAPRYRTRMKMLWDDTYLYIAAEMEEPHVWASLKNHDDIVFRDNDFEVFIDPDGDTREYYELEANAFGTIFDLYLYRRYKEEGPAEHGWNCEGLKTAIHIDGTLNDPTDTDKGWSLEWAIPWSSLTPPKWERPSFTEAARAAAVPKPGDEWRINFSRVQWLHNWEGTTAPKDASKDASGDASKDASGDASKDASGDASKDAPGDASKDAPKDASKDASGDASKDASDTARPAYVKTPGKPEDNWVWTPQWQIDMHDPRWWGRVRFTK